MAANPSPGPQGIRCATARRAPPQSCSSPYPVQPLLRRADGAAGVRRRDLEREGRGTTEAVRAVWARVPGEAYAVTLSGAVLRYDGNAWTIIREAEEGLYLHTVWAKD